MTSRTKLPLLLRLCIPAALIALLAACGADEQTPVRIDLQGNSVVWTGFADSDPELKTRVDEAVTCLRMNRLTIRPGYPYLLVIDGVFSCNGVLARGCTDMNSGSIYMDSRYLETSVFVHEVVHWETGMGNGYHDTQQFNCCIPDE
ncbi:MAG: hypothetical protein A2010_07300 [Nitrospirae bacterium GWD2_57_9]|nr:MAG: hypothetical protein A2010_07300 [Nitrospirae bacterium GWD2_57_9]